MKDTRAFDILTSDTTSMTQFARWHSLLGSRASVGLAGERLMPEFGFKYSLRTTERPVPDCDLTWGIEAEGRTVQINPATSAGDANVLSAIAEDRNQPGRYVLLRQGRLQRNRQTIAQISGGEFRHAFGRLPVSARGSFGARGREWFLVCDLVDDAEEVARQTAEFVRQCAVVRSTYGAPANAGGGS